MFEKKKLWMVMATAALVTACGGGSDPAPVTGGDGDPPPVSSTDTKLQNSHLVMHPDQMIVNMILPTAAYEETTAANGGLFGQATGTAGNGAPFQSFGLRIDDIAGVAEGAAVEAESATGRLAISLTERAETVDATAGEVAENVTIILTGVTLSTDATGVVSATQAEGAAMHVSGTNAAGEVIDNIDVTLPAGVISIVPITDVVGGADDTSGDVGLIFNLENAFAAAEGTDETELGKLAALSGRFDMNFALSAADIHRSDAALEGQTITATSTSMANVTGSGIPGNIWITATPPATP